MSDTTYRLLEGEQLEYSGGVEVKGIGLMDTYIWAPPPPPRPAEPPVPPLQGQELQQAWANMQGLLQVQRQAGGDKGPRDAASPPGGLPNELHGSSKIGAVIRGSSETGVRAADGVRATSSGGSRAAVASGSAWDRSSYGSGPLTMLPSPWTNATKMPGAPQTADLCPSPCNPRGTPGKGTMSFDKILSVLSTQKSKSRSSSISLHKSQGDVMSLYKSLGG